MKATSTVEDHDMGMEALMKRIMASADHVDIGIHADEDELLIKIAAAHEFGATIHHPGGTAYGYKTAMDAKRHAITFLKGGSGFNILGRTKPHVIQIPMRSYIRSTMDKNAQKYERIAQGLMRQIIDGTLDKFGALQLMGQQIESDIKRTIVTMKEPPLKAATIARKGSSALLQDKGHLKGAIRYVVKDAEDKSSEQKEAGK